jgi:hypothetical protein
MLVTTTRHNVSVRHLYDALPAPAKRAVREAIEAEMKYTVRPAFYNKICGHTSISDRELEVFTREFAKVGITIK